MIVNILPPSVTVTADPQTVGISVGTPIARDFVERDPYTGSYTITPSAEAQTLLTKDLRMTDNLTIEAIPHNYGLITWSGSGIRVS